MLSKNNCKRTAFGAGKGRDARELSNKPQGPDHAEFDQILNKTSHRVSYQTDRNANRYVEEYTSDGKWVERGIDCNGVHCRLI